MSKQQHFECSLFLDRKDAMKVKKLINNGGFVEAHSKSHLSTNQFRIVIYHELLKVKVESCIGKNEIAWIEKNLSEKNNTE